MKIYILCIIKRVTKGSKIPHRKKRFLQTYIPPPNKNMMNISFGTNNIQTFSFQTTYKFIEFNIIRLVVIEMNKFTLCL